jgi:hypothetical protein
MAKDIHSGVTFVINGTSNELAAGKGFEFTELQALTDCRFAAIKAAEGFKADNIAAMVLPAGVSLHVHADSFQLLSGSVLAYYAQTVDKKEKQ